MPEPMPPKNPNKIMGMPKWAFWAMLAGGLILAFYLYKKNQTNSQDTAASLGVDPTQGVTAADVGGTPSDYGTPYDTSGGYGADNSAQISALGDQLSSSLNDLSSQVASLSAAGVGPSAASPPQSFPTLPIDVTVNTKTPKAKAKPKKHPKPKKRPVHHPKKR